MTNAQKKRLDELAESLRANSRTWREEVLPNGDVEIKTTDDAPQISALIRADGFATLTWPDGSETVDVQP